MREWLRGDLTMTRNNEKQADVLDGAVILENPRGSAPGQWLDTVYGEHRKLVMLMPGPPSELKPMFDEECVPSAERGAAADAHRDARAQGGADRGIGGGCAHCSHLHPVHGCGNDDSGAPGGHSAKPAVQQSEPGQAQARVDELASRIEEELDDLIYSSQGESLEQIVLFHLEMRGATLSVAESCTGGMVAERLTSISGSSRSFVGGAVVYSNELKTEFADVSPVLIERHGAVSREVAAALAEGIRDAVRYDFRRGSYRHCRAFRRE